MSIRTEFKLTGLDGVLATLQSLPAEIVSKRGGPVKLSLAKGARLLRDYAKESFRRSAAVDGADSTDTTVNNIISSRGKEPIGSKGERYLVRVKGKRFVNAHGAETTTRKAAQLMEYGSSTQEARPWLRPLVPRRGAQIIDVVTEDLVRRIQKTVRKLANQNKVKG